MTDKTYQTGTSANRLRDLKQIDEIGTELGLSKEDIDNIFFYAQEVED